MMFQPFSILSRKNRNRKASKDLLENKLDIKKSPTNIPQAIKTNTLSLIHFLRLGFILILCHKVLHVLFRSARGIKTRTVGQFRMVSQDYRGETSTGETKKSSPVLQPTRLVLDDETVQKYKKKLESLTDEDRLTEYNKEKSLGNECFNRSQYASAVQHYTHCILSQPGSVVGYSNRAAALLKMNKYTQALEDCNEALKIDPNHAKAKYRRGMALHHKNCFREALQDFEDVVRSDPNNFLANHFMSKIRELLYTQPRDIRLRAKSSEGKVIHIPEKEYRFNPSQYSHCVPVNEWGLRKSFCSCISGEPEFLRSYRKEVLKLKYSRNDSKRRYRYNGSVLSEKGDSDSDDSPPPVVKATPSDTSISILAEGLKRSLSGGKDKTAPSSDQTAPVSVTGTSILETTLKSCVNITVNPPSPSGNRLGDSLSDSETVDQLSKSDLSDPFDTKPNVPLIRDMPFLGDEEMINGSDVDINVPSTRIVSKRRNKENTGFIKMHAAKDSTPKPTETAAPVVLETNNRPAYESVETKNELTNGIVDTKNESICATEKTEDEINGRVLANNLLSDNVDPISSKTVLRPRKSKNTEKPVTNVNQIDDKQSETKLENHSGGFEANIPKTNELVNQTHNKLSQIKPEKRSSRFDDSTFQTIELNQIHKQSENNFGNANVNGVAKDKRDIPEISPDISEAAPDISKASPWTEPNPHPVDFQTSNISLAQIGILPCEHKLKSVGLVKEAMAAQTSEKSQKPKRKNAKTAENKTKVNGTEKPTKDVKSSGILADDLESLDELAKSLQIQANDLKSSEQGLAKSAETSEEFANNLKSSNTSDTNSNTPKESSAINNNVNELNANYQKPARKNAKVIDAKGNIAKIPNDFKSSSARKSSIDTAKQNSASKQYDLTNSTAKQNGTISENSTTKQNSTITNNMNGDHVMEEPIQVVMNGTSDGDNLPEPIVKTLTKASKRHIRRRNFKLNKQSQESSESVPCKL